MTSEAEKRDHRLLVAALGICATGRQSASADLCDTAQKQLSHLWAENERLREALEYGKDLIEGEAVGAEWKQKCLHFIRKAAAALGKGGSDDQ